jgi:hypothetical protein
MVERGGYHDDTYDAERNWRRTWRRNPTELLVVASTALIVVGAIAVVGWLWLALRSQGVLGDSAAGLFDVTAAQRIDFLVGTLDNLVIPVLGIAVGLALRRYAEDTGS